MRDLLAWFGGFRAARVDREADVAVDPHLANTRATGGAHCQHSDSGTTTGVGFNQMFVGRVAGEDLGYCQLTGAEARAGQRR